MRASRTPGTSIRSILVGSLVLVVLVPFLPLAYFTWRSYRGDVERVEEEIQATNRQIGLLATNYLERFVRAVHAEARLALRAPQSGLPEASPAVWWERVDGRGAVVASQVAAVRVGRDSGYGAYLDALGAGGAVGPSPVGRWIQGGPPTVLFAFARGPENGPASTPAGARPERLVAVLRPEGLHRQLAAQLDPTVDRRVYVVDRAGSLVFYSDLALSRRGEDLRENPPVRRFRAGSEGPIGYVSRVTGKERLGFVQRSATTEWGVVVSADVGSGLIGLHGRYLSLIWSILFALVAALAILLLTSRRLLRPVLRIRDALRSPERRSHEPLAVDPDTLGVAEYGDLVRAFDELSARLALTETELIQAEKTALLGQLASGIAHEIGTPLNVMSGYAQYLMRRLPPEDEARTVLQKIVKQAERLAEMVRRVLDFARPTEARMEAVELRDVVAHALEMAGGLLKGVHVEIAVSSRTPPVLGNPRLLEHAVLNLVMNGVQACQSRREGAQLTIETGLAAGGHASDEPWIYCRLTDNGCGIPEDQLDKIFQPFFTTKPQGRGTGLGLAIVERIIRQHRGQIEVRSQPGTGTEFTIRLRRAPVAAEADMEATSTGS